MTTDRVALASQLLAVLDLDAPAASRDHLLALAATLSDPVARAVVLTQAARAAGLAGERDRAEGLLDEASAQADDLEVALRVALERGRLLRSGGDPDAARAWFERALELSARSLDDAPLGGLSIDARHMLALLLDDPEAQARATREALELAGSSLDPFAPRWRASLLNNLGCALVDAGRPDEALAAFDEALLLREAEGDRRRVQIARWMVGWGLRLVGRREEALAVQRHLLQELHADGIDDVHVVHELEILSGDDAARWHSG